MNITWQQVALVVVGAAALVTLVLTGHVDALAAVVGAGVNLLSLLARSPLSPPAPKETQQ